MSALFDGQHYLIEKYAVNLIPSLQLLSPQIASREQISVLMGGATDAPSFERENLNALPNVEKELEGISREVSRKKQLLQQDFVEANIQQQINSSPFSIVHIATHGNFSSNPEQTYVLDWTRRIKIEDLERLLRLNRQRDKQPIDLLILSACETATGDRRAALGLAGVAIRAGARSTIATLWQVNDASTAELMIQFYQNLQNPQLTKAEALRQAQLKLLNKENYLDRDYNRAYYWAPFVIVGNWL
jgi:CHAT domain-containing protein